VNRLATAQIQSEVELRLRQSGPMINIINSDDAPRVALYEQGAQKCCTTTRIPRTRMKAQATTWSTNAVGSVGVKVFGSIGALSLSLGIRSLTVDASRAALDGTPRHTCNADRR
jgi:hypothetical protein